MKNRKTSQTGGSWRRGTSPRSASASRRGSPPWTHRRCPDSEVASSHGSRADWRSLALLLAFGRGRLPARLAALADKHQATGDALFDEQLEGPHVRRGGGRSCIELFLRDYLAGVVRYRLCRTPDAAKKIPALLEDLFEERALEASVSDDDGPAVRGQDRLQRAQESGLSTAALPSLLCGMDLQIDRQGAPAYRHCGHQGVLGLASVGPVDQHNRPGAARIRADGTRAKKNEQPVLEPRRLPKRRSTHLMPCFGLASPGRLRPMVAGVSRPPLMTPSVSA